MGAGAGGVAGLISTLFKKDRTLGDYLKHALVGGGVGAAAGVGLGGLRRSDEASTPPPASEEPKRLLSGNGAALSGLFPIIGPAIYGATQSEDGARLDNALRLGGASTVGSIPGGIAIGLGSGGKNITATMLANILAMAGSAYGTRKMTDHINKQATTATIYNGITKSASSLTEQLTNLKTTLGQQYNQARTGLGNLGLNPLNPGQSALSGGVGGAAIGGGVGLLKALLDSEDDGVMGTLGKTLQGIGIGGVGGAALGGGYSMLERNKLMGRVKNQDPKFRRLAERAMDSYSVPVRVQMDKIMGTANPNGRSEIAVDNFRRGASSLMAPALVSKLEQAADQ